MSHSESFDVKKIGSRYAVGVLVILTLIYTINFVDRQIVAVLATQIRRDLGISNLQIGYLYGTAFSFFYAIFGIPMGRLADVYSRRVVIVIGLLIWSLATFFSGLATSFGLLLMARILVGINEAACSPAAYSLLSDYFKPSQRATVISIYTSGIFIGIGLSFLIGGTIGELYNWRIAFYAVGVPGVFLAGIAYYYIKEIPRGISDHKKQENTPSLKEVLTYILKKPAIVLHNLGFAFLAFSGYSLLAFISNIFMDRYHTPLLLPQYGWFMFLTGVTVMISGKLADRLAKKGGGKRFWLGIFAALGCLPFFYLGFYAKTGFEALLFIGLGASIASSYNGVAPAIIQDLVKPGMRALAGGVYLFVISIIGFGFGPPVTGYLIDNVYTGPNGLAHALMTVMVTCGIVATLFLLAAMKFYEHEVS